MSVCGCVRGCVWVWVFLWTLIFLFFFVRRFGKLTFETFFKLLKNEKNKKQRKKLFFQRTPTHHTHAPTRPHTTPTPTTTHPHHRHPRSQHAHTHTHAADTHTKKMCFKMFLVCVCFSSVLSKRFNRLKGFKSWKSKLPKTLGGIFSFLGFDFFFWKKKTQNLLKKKLKKLNKNKTKTYKL